MEKQHICPWWLGYTFILPIRKYKHDPLKILAPYIKEGMAIMDYGSAMGYFSIPLAKMTGPKGLVYCVDIQAKMLEKLQKRAVKYGVSDIVKPLQVGINYKPIELTGALDFVLLFAVVHEVPDKTGLFKDIFSMLKPGAKVLFSEPRGHVNMKEFENSISIAKNAGFKTMEEKPLKKGLAVLLQK
jgi:2-polyprenyl-3-methyl-5-hydroxy-6-metoxy-1,4-benzoquinol methylase